MGTNERRRIGVVLALAVLAVIAGCTGGAGGAASPEHRDATTGLGGQAGGVEATATPTAERAAANEPADLPADRARIQTGHLQLEVDAFEAARRNVTAATQQHGGFVSDSHERLHGSGNTSYTTGQLILRVPAENFTGLMERLSGIGTVRERDTNSRDVTDQLVDINARLGNLRAERDRLRQLYDRANDTESVLAVERRLSEVQTEIERLEARQQSLEQRVALSTITVELREPRPEPESPAKWYEVGIIKAFLESVDGVGVSLRALSVAVAYALPYAVVFGVPIAGLVIAVLRWRGRLSGSGL